MMFSRRELFARSGLGFGAIALSHLLMEQGLIAGSESTGSGRRPTKSHLPAQAKAMIQLVQNGGPSQMDLFDPKPELSKRDGQRHSFKVEMFQPGSEANELMGTPFEFRKYGRAGMDFSEVLTHTPSIADEITMIRSMMS